jgi:D-psicose/D-tagatose/L-ribulose 3-epimerase
MNAFRLSASNIAWEPAEDDAAAKVLLDHGFTGVEIAPTKRWESPIEATKKEIADYRSAWNKRGLEIVSMQSLLFGRNDLQLFGSSLSQRALKEFITGLIELAAGLGATSLVFGSPKNRKRGKLPLDQATEIASEFFREMGAIAASRNCVLCIEPNPPEYECDFINTMPEAVEIARSARGRGVGVQCDIGSMLYNGEDPGAAIRAADPFVRHVHVSEKELAEPTSRGANESVAGALKEIGYRGWVSIEMRAPKTGSRVEALARAASFVSGIYK